MRYELTLTAFTVWQVDIAHRGGASGRNTKIALRSKFKIKCHYSLIISAVGRNAYSYRVTSNTGWYLFQFFSVSNISAGLISRRHSDKNSVEFEDFEMVNFNLNEEACGDRPHPTPVTVSCNHR